jgi:nucleotide sugar dehydrogenase
MLKEKIVNKETRICVVGLGYVGLPFAIEMAKIGFSVTGIDLNKNRVKSVNAGENYISDTKDDELKALVKQGKLRAVNEFSPVKNMDIIVICVPTSLTKNLVPDLEHVKSATKEIASKLRQGQLICLESTTYPGTTEEVVLPILESSGLKVEKDFYLCHSPERVDPGNQNYKTENINKIIGGVGSNSLEMGIVFYAQFIEQVVPVSSVKVAELAKIYENTFRAVNIALVNEFAMLCDKMHLSVWEVLDAAFTKPFGILPFYPGLGVGGHCIPVDPHYLEWKAREYNFVTRFIGVAGEINRKMPEFVREIVFRTLNEMGITPSKSKILVIGMAYKKDINDYRESPSIILAELLLKDGIDLIYHDPYIKQIEVSCKQLTSVALSEEVVKKANIVLIATDHSAIDYPWLVQTAEKIIDTRNATKGITDREKKVVLI